MPPTYEPPVSVEEHLSRNKDPKSSRRALKELPLLSIEKVDIRDRVVELRCDKSHILKERNIHAVSIDWPITATIAVKEIHT